MGSKCCTGRKGAVIDDISEADLPEQNEEVNEMEAADAGSSSIREAEAVPADDAGSASSELGTPSATSSILEVLVKFSVISFGYQNEQEEDSTGVESPISVGEDGQPLPNIRWSTHSFSGKIRSGYYSVIPGRSLTFFRKMPTQRELRDLGGEGVDVDVIKIDLQNDKKLFMIMELIVDAFAKSNMESELERAVKKTGQWVAKVHRRETSQSRAETPESSTSRDHQRLVYIKNGTCCTRAILFKVLADAIGIDCKLVVGFPGGRVKSHHHISVVVDQDNEEKLVDLMGRPGKLIPMSTEAINGAHASTPWSCSCHLPLAPNSPNGNGAGQLGRMRRRLNETPESSNAAARAMRVSNSSRQSRFSNGRDSSPRPPYQTTRSESFRQIRDLFKQVLGSPTFQNKPLLPYGKWNIDISEVKVGSLIGRGRFGKVYRGSWTGTDVAIKVFLEQDLVVENIKDFCNEIYILSRLRHPNVIMFLGACTKPPRLSLVTELMENGSLYHLLYSPGDKTELIWKRKLEMLRDICKGLACIHRMGIVHRDLKSANCLLSREGKVKICDFGLSRIMKDMTVKDYEPAGTPEWMAPELIRNEPFSQKCDIFSFGVIMWELSTLSKPWEGVPLPKVVYTVAYKGARLEIPDGPLSELIAACWSEPEQRPSCEEILTELAICEYSL